MKFLKDVYEVFLYGISLFFKGMKLKINDNSKPLYMADDEFKFRVLLMKTGTHDDKGAYLRIIKNGNEKIIRTFEEYKLECCK